MEFRDGVIVITGGGSGIGEELAHAAVREGARHVAVVDRHADQAQRVADAVAGSAFGVDVRDEQAIREVVDRTQAAHGPISLFCSNAGVLGDGGVEEPNERLQALWEIHVMAHIYAARAVLPSMIANGRGYLLNTSSAVGLLTQIGSLGYTITKSAAISLAEWLSISHYHQGIRVSVLCPQSVRTNMVKNSGLDLDYDSLVKVAAGDGMMEPADVATLCFDAMREERFMILPQAEVHEYALRKASDIERWLAGMRRFQDRLYPGGNLPGDVIAAGVP